MTRRPGMIATLVLTILLGWVAASSYFSEEQRKAHWWIPDDAIRLGLDLRGGIHMVIAPDLAVATQHELNHMRSSLESRLATDGVKTKSLAVAGDALELELSDPAQGEAIRELVGGEFDALRAEETAPGTFRLRLSEQWAKVVRQRAMDQVLEVIRRRVDDPATGIAESVVTKQGDSRILVQIPGVSVVPDIFKQTGFLEFKIVQDGVANEKGEELLRAKYPDGLPPNTEILLEKDKKTKKVVAAYLLPTEPDITGKDLQDARSIMDPQRAEWQVSFKWNGEGAETFAALTEKNMRKQLAVILDDQVYSAPVIQARISRDGVITGRFNADEAGALAIILRAGSLPIPVVLEEERTIGPALGADSISSGISASLLAAVLVVAFMVVYYRLSGFYASVGMVVNLVMVVALMVIFGATLTLPGIAGLALTVGMAVDANVLIFERIREEIRAGKAVRAAIPTGFDKAFWTIFDAHVTTLLTAWVLYIYGTGPIKGFAVTLAVGLVVNMFCALVVTRQLYALHPGDEPVEQLSI